VRKAVSQVPGNIERDVFHTTQSVSVRALAIQEFDQNVF
jgi:hypothetical protein